LSAAYRIDAGQPPQLVADAVPGYHPAGKNGSEHKGEAFALQMEAIIQNEEKKLASI